MREKRVDTVRIIRAKGLKGSGFEESIVLYVIFLFLIVLITVVSMLQSSRIKVLEERIQVLENGSVVAVSELKQQDERNIRDSRDTSTN